MRSAIVFGAAFLHTLAEASGSCLKHDDVMLLQREPPPTSADSCRTGGLLAFRRHGLQHSGPMSLLQSLYTPITQVPGASTQPHPAQSIIPKCNCPPPAVVKEAEGPEVIEPVIGCPGELEVLTVDVGLANRVRCDNATLAAELAMAVGIPVEQLHIIPWSWTPSHQVGLNLLQEMATEQAEAIHRRSCNCAAPNFLQEDAAPGPSPAPAPAPENPCLRPKLNISLLGDAPSKVQMLTRDPCLVKALRNDPGLFQKAIADLMHIDIARISIGLPTVAGDEGLPTPMPHIPEAVLNGSVQVPMVPPTLDYTSVTYPFVPPTLPPGVTTTMPLPGATTPMPTPQPTGPPEVNRPWISTWSVEFLPPKAAETAEQFLRLVDTTHSNLAQLLPMTYARVPGMPHPGFEVNAVHEIRMPPPRDVAESFGLPMGDIGPEPPDATVIAAADRAWMRAMMINDEGTRLNHAVAHMTETVKYAENAAKDELYFPRGPVSPGRLAPEIIPPSLATDVTMESPYGPWPNSPPYADSMRPAGVPDPALLATSSRVNKGLRGRGNTLQRRMLAKR